jgi:tRNA uridine 5-carboxymethylaminomethyl modification enzyme
MASINAVRYVRGEAPVVLGRDQAYIGVMIDDLVTKGTKEPYRMFTSRAEYRLLLREDNADLRLRELGHQIGLVSNGTYEKFERKRTAVDQLLTLLSEARLNPKPDVKQTVENLGLGTINQPVTLKDLLKRPGAGLKDIAQLDSRVSSFNSEAGDQATILVKYDGYIRRQMEQIERARHLERAMIPEGLDYEVIPGLSNEVKEKLTRTRPISLGQASRISGITPAAVTIVQIYLKKWEQDARK